MTPRRSSMRLLGALCAGVVALGLSASAAARSHEETGGTPGTNVPATSPFNGDGMWIWIASKSNRGSPDAIAARAKASGIETVFLKSGDAGNYWSQFSPGFVSALKQRGLKVCAWQYVYGKRPSAEAAVSARAVKNGADCFVIDAEAEYEGRYRAALTYMRKLRAKVGADYPIGLSSFPYVHYHPSFPYSVFLGAGGAQYNVPQMYWRAIGTSVSSIYSVTYTYNHPYSRPIFPVGQVYMNPSGLELSRFRTLAQVNGATGLSWWDWQEAKARHWRALAKKVGSTGSLLPTSAYPTLKKGNRGDLVLWAQEHLVADYGAPATGIFGSKTVEAVTRFRADRGLGVGGAIDSATWSELLKRPADPAAFLRSGAASTASRHKTQPQSARLPARAYELPRNRRR